MAEAAMVYSMASKLATRVLSPVTVKVYGLVAFTTVPFNVQLMKR